MLRYLSVPLHALLVFYISLSASVNAADEKTLVPPPTLRQRGYSKGELIPVSCLNRTVDTGEHITDEHGNLQYIPFPTCLETGTPLSFEYNTPRTQTCTIEALPDELYHLLEFFVHSDVPLSCRVPSAPLDQEEHGVVGSSLRAAGGGAGADKTMWTPLTVALQGTLQLSHLHLHTNINVLFHMSQESTEPSRDRPGESRLIGSTAYSLPTNSSSGPSEGSKVVRYEPLVFTFNVGWIDGAVLPGMVGRPFMKVTDHSVGFSLLSFFALAASAGIGAMAMLVYERRKRGRSGVYGNGILGGNVGQPRNSSYVGYGGYNSGPGKRD